MSKIGIIKRKTEKCWGCGDMHQSTDLLQIGDMFIPLCIECKMELRDLLQKDIDDWCKERVHELELAEPKSCDVTEDMLKHKKYWDNLVSNLKEYINE